VFGKYTKFLVAVVTAVSAIAADGLLHGTVQHYATILVTVAGALGVFALPNRPGPTPVGPQTQPDPQTQPEPRFTLAEIDAIRALLAGAPPSPTQPPTMQGATRR